MIGEDGKQLGIMPTHIACRIAEEKGLDLVEVNPKGTPPVCKIIDHGRFKYEEAKKKRASKKKQTVVQIKEVKLRPKTDTHDLEVKTRATLKFLADGNKAKLVVQFRGREIVHPETGKTVLMKVLQELEQYAVVEQMPVMEGRRMSMMIAPKPGAVIPKRFGKGTPDDDALDAAAQALADAEDVDVDGEYEDDELDGDDFDGEEGIETTEAEEEPSAVPGGGESTPPPRVGASPES